MKGKMRKIKPEFIYDEENRQRGVLLSIKDFDYLIEELEDYYDYKLVEKLEPFNLEDTISMEDVKKEIFGK
ncbi:TPA: hypothetical protein DIC20_02240 [Candidatus Dependentiae bacterium]|nr:hypothetical protein [Candidatus Dependentiae bacterium]HCU00504.1 hypothetical protein [Candidatus Dependentiae bacterium]